MTEHKHGERVRLPNRRENFGTTFRWPEGAQHRTHVALGPDAAGVVREVFLRGGAKVRSHLDYQLDDVGVLISRLLQHGDTLAEIAKGLGRGEVGEPMSIIGASADALLELENELKKELA